MAMLTPAEVRDANARYHDGAAAGYDAKWSIDFDAVSNCDWSAHGFYQSR